MSLFSKSNNKYLKNCLIKNSFLLALLFLIIHIVFIIKNDFLFDYFTIIFILVNFLFIFVIPFIRIKMGLFAIVYFLIFLLLGIFDSIIIYFHSHIIQWSIINLALTFFIAGISLGITNIFIGNCLSSVEYKNYRILTDEFIDNSSIRLKLCIFLMIMGAFFLSLSMVFSPVTFSTLAFNTIAITVFAYLAGNISTSNNDKIKHEISNGFQKILDNDFDISIKCYTPDECGKLSITMSKAIEKIKNVQRNVMDIKNSYELNIDRLIERFGNVVDKIDSNLNELNAMRNVIGRINNEFQDLHNSTDTMFVDFQNDYSQISKTLEEYDDSLNTINKVNTMIIESFKNAQSIKLLQNQLISIISTSKQLTNNIKVLSINAEIEAADAGEYGKRFKVIAEEIRVLAEKSAKSTLNTEETINIISNYISTLSIEIEKTFDILSESENKFIKLKESSQKALLSLESLKENGKGTLKSIYKIQLSNGNIKEIVDRQKEILINITSEFQQIKEYIVVLSDSMDKLEA